MPRIVIKTLPLGDGHDVRVILQRLGKIVESDFGCLPNQFVMIWEFIRPGHFLYDGRLVDFQPGSTHHPFIEITAVKGISQDREKALVRMLAGALSRELDVEPKNVCVTVNELDSGHLFVFGDFK